MSVRADGGAGHRGGFGANLASIGYHFGTREALLDAAMMEAVGDWGGELGRVLAAEVDEDTEPVRRFE